MVDITVAAAMVLAAAAALLEQARELTTGTAVMQTLAAAADKVSFVYFGGTGELSQARM